MAGEFSGDRTAHNNAIWETMRKYDMVTSPNEAYYARQYLHWIIPELEKRSQGKGIKILDLGCGQGRLTVPIALWALRSGGEIIGVELVEEALEKARERCRRLGNVTLVREDILKFIREQEAGSFDAALFIEVSFFFPEWELLMGEMARVISKGGVIFASFRSQYYNLLQTVWSWKWEAAKMVLEKREGYLWGEPVWYTWQTPDEIIRKSIQVGLKVVSMRGIGVCSGLEEDPLGTIIRPSELSWEDQERLMEIECAAAEAYAGCGRYILAILEKPAET